MSPILRRGFLVLCLLSAFVAFAGADGQIRGKVVKVRDGDSMEIRSDGQNVRVRVFGVDAPERGQPWSARAKSFTAGLVGNQEVVVEVKDVDRYGRKVGEVVLADGRDLGHELLREGLAWYYRRYANDPSLEKLEADARAAKRGLWSEPHPVPPWKFRSDRRAGDVRKSYCMNHPVQVERIHVPISIKNPDVEQLARAVAAEAGESLTEAVRHSLEERLERMRGSRRAPTTFESIMEISLRCRVLPDRDQRSPDELLGYDERGTFG